MDWVVLSYSLPARRRSGLRVALWRRLRRLGALSPAGGVHILPARDECLEAFHWLAREIQHAQGEALVMRVAQFEGLTDQQLIDLFCQARQQDFDALNSEVARLEKALRARKKRPALAGHPEALARLRRRQAEIARVDYFGCPAGMRVAARLSRLEEALSPNPPPGANITPAIPGEYQGKTWVTRPHPHVDRLACAWLIRRFINANAAIRYASRAEPDEVAFDMDEGWFGHQDNLCTFETMTQAFGLIEPGLRALAEIVHEIDLRDGRYVRPETSGIETVLEGWRRAGLSDAELESRGVALFDGLYAALSGPDPDSKAQTAPRQAAR